MLGRLFRRKSLDAAPPDAVGSEHQLRRALGPLQLTLLGIGAIIGAGIFATIGTAAAGDLSRPGAGPALMVSFVITAIVCGFSALCYAEFAALVPVSGSAYSYTYATLGKIAAWIIGWDLIIEYAVGNVAVAISWANYCKTFVAGFGVVIPDWLAMDYRTAAKVVDATGMHTVYRDAPHVCGVPIVFSLLAVGIVTVITVILVWGIRESVRVNTVMVSIKILVLLFFIFVGCRWVQPTKLRFAAWLNCGFVIYAGYGVVHSRLTGQHHSKRPAEHDAYAAYVGAWLALIGTILLFCMRGCDLWLAALKKPEEVAGSTRAGVALVEVLRPQSWLELSWFLVVPLALTAFVLCPIIIRRALRAQQAGVSDSYRRAAISSLSVASVVGVTTVIYLLLVVLFHQS